MQKKYVSVGFDWKVFVRGCKEHIFTYPQHFIYKFKLRIIISDVLNNTITENPVECVILEGKHTSRISDKSFIRMASGHFSKILYSKSCIELSSIPKVFQEHIDGR
jgi:hypothetical protein